MTGGDPLCCPNIKIAIQALHNKAGIIVDTNGFLVTEEHLKLFKKYGVFVRVSIDSERPQVNQELRPSKNRDHCTLAAALKCVDLCLAQNIPVGIQTVITNKNLSDIASLFPKLIRLGVRGWRLLYLAKHSEFSDYESYKPNGKRFYRNIRDSLRVKSTGGSDEVMWVQVLHNSEPDAVILVSPEGHFYTEQEGGKVILDENSPSKPSLDSIKDTINRSAHLDRYLSIKEMPHVYVGK